MAEHGRPSADTARQASNSGDTANGQGNIGHYGGLSPSLRLLNDEDSRIGWERLQRYQEYCEHYRVTPSQTVSIVFRHPIVKRLELDETFGVADILPLCEMLRYDNVITVLDAHRAKPLGNSGCIAIAHALLMNRTLREINMNYQDIRDYGTVMLAGGLEQSRLQRVYLRGNKIGVLGAMALATVLRKTRTLSYMDVSNNYLRVRGVHELTRALIMRAEARMSADWAAERQDEINTFWTQQMQSAMQNMDAADVPQPLPLPVLPNERERPKPINGILAGGGLGWLWGNASDLVVTSNYVVRTNFSSKFPFPGSSTAADADEKGGDGQQHRAATTERRTRSGSRHRSGSTGRQTASEETDTSNNTAETAAVDIEVRISGNFIQEEVFNSIVHGLGLVGSVIGAFPMLSRASSTGDNNRMIGSLLYIIGLIAFFASSTLNHSLFLTDASKVFRLIDHSAVSLLIAGTYSPFLLSNTYLMQPLSNALLAGVWLLAAVGVVASTLYPDEGAGGMMQHMRMFLYVAMGYLGVVPFFMLYPCIAPTGWALLAAGGLIFSFGVVLYFRRNRSNPHVLHSWWYVFVLLACTIHYFAIYTYVHAPVPSCHANDFAYSVGLVWPLANGTCAAAITNDAAGDCVSTTSSSSSPVAMPSNDPSVSEALAAAAATLSAVAADGTKAMRERTIDLLKEAIAALQQ